MDKDWRLELIDPDAYPMMDTYLDTTVRKAALVLYMLRYLQYNRANMPIYHQDMQRELLINAEGYLEELIIKVELLANRLDGLTYAPRDMWDTLEEYRNDEGTLLLVNPPRYTGGYDRMFAGIDAVLSWDEPKIAQFTEDDYKRLMEMLGTSEATTLMYYATPGDDPTPLWGEPWRAVFADRPGNKRVAAVNWIIANQSLIDHASNRAKIVLGKAKYPLFDGEIRSDSKLHAERIDQETGDYCRDLFIHKLPGSVTQAYVALLIDGALMGVIGLHLRDLRMAHDPEADTWRAGFVTFAFSPDHPAYKRLHKLTLMSLVSGWFWDDVMGGESFCVLNGRPLTVRSTMLTPHPENKTARGIMKLVKRKREPTGGYKLIYKADVIDRDRWKTIQE